MMEKEKLVENKQIEEEEKGVTEAPEKENSEKKSTEANMMTKKASDNSTPQEPTENSPKAKADPEQAESSSEDDSSSEEKVPPPRKPKPQPIYRSDNFKKLSLQQSVLHGETNVKEIMKNLDKEAEEAPKEAEYLEPNKSMKLIGHVMNKIGQECVNLLALENTRPLEVGTKVVLKNRRVLGGIKDIFGPITQHMYAVLTESTDGVNVSDPVFVAEDEEKFANVVLDKGCDASWVGDIECPPEHMDYSDDEEESKARKKKAALKRNKRSGPR